MEGVPIIEVVAIEGIGILETFDFIKGLV